MFFFGGAENSQVLISETLNLIFFELNLVGTRILQILIVVHPICLFLNIHLLDKVHRL